MISSLRMDVDVDFLFIFGRFEEVRWGPLYFWVVLCGEGWGINPQAFPNYGEGEFH
jgi:hypothetical protein